MKPVVKQIKIPKELKAILSDKNKTRLVKNIAIRKYTGICCRCDAIATKKVSYDMQGAQLVERYCDKHFVVK